MSESKHKPPTVLLVDDDDNILASLQRLLRNESYSIITANCGAEAVGILNTKEIDLIVCDYTMPGPGETELFQLVCKRWPEKVRVLITGHLDTESLVRAVSDGEAYRFVQKPWNDEELVLTIRQSLEKAELLNETRRLADEMERYRKALAELNPADPETEKTSVRAETNRTTNNH